MGRSIVLQTRPILNSAVRPASPEVDPRWKCFWFEKVLCIVANIFRGAKLGLRSLLPSLTLHREYYIVRLGIKNNLDGMTEFNRHDVVKRESYNDTQEKAWMLKHGEQSLL